VRFALQAAGLAVSTAAIGTGAGIVSTGGGGGADMSCGVPFKAG
jgi:RNA-splicing ligase RtcB